MARDTARVEGATLIGRTDTAQAILAGTPAWHTRPDKATRFAPGRSTARKDPRGDGWKACRKRSGRVRTTAATLAAAIAPPDGDTAGASIPPATPTIGAPMALPTGTLTFCFTDIEGSTQLWEQYPHAMPAALARHDAILGTVIAAHGGVVFKSVGDSAHAVFAGVPDALTAALAAQQALQAEPWGPTGPLRVRMALHSGVAEQRDGDYFGAALNRVARILALGHGGQILLSHTTRDLVADDLPAQASLRDLGEYSLRDLSRPEQIFQLLHPDLPSEFPRLWTLESHPVPAVTPPLQILATKLYAPPPRRQLVARERLLERLRSGLTGKLTLISAPAGFGKTTLVSEWLAKLRIGDEELRKRGSDNDSQCSTLHSQFKVAWVSLDVNDNDALRFWSYVIAALETVYPHVGATTMALLRLPQPPVAEAFLTPLLNALSALPADVALVLDDYHLISTPAIHAAVTFLLDHLPPQLHVIMLTRADPPLALTRLRARRELAELRAAELRFTAEEATAFLTEMIGLPLTGEQVAALEARTEGWVAGLQLAALAMQNRTDRAGFVAAFSGSNRFVVDYLVEEVLNQLPRHLQTFVLQTSIFDQLCGSLCDAVLGIETFERSNVQTFQPGSVQTAYSQLILDQLEQANLFLIPLDDERRWYR
jgi:class 3 adenylate cyclase